MTLTGMAAKVLAYVLAAAAVVTAIYLGVDSVVGAFRDRTALRDKVAQQETAASQLRSDVAAARAAAEQAHQEAKQAADDAKAEIALRDLLALEARGRQVQIAKELKDAKRRLDAWAAAAADDLRRCLALPVPDDDVGVHEATDQAGPGAGADAEGAHRVPIPAGGVPG